MLSKAREISVNKKLGQKQMDGFTKFLENDGE